MNFDWPDWTDPEDEESDEDPTPTYIYKTLFVPVITYCISIWEATFDTELDQLQVIQNDALRTIFNIPRNQSAKYIYTKNKLLDLRQLYRYNLAILAYKNFNGFIHADAKFHYISKSIQCASFLKHSRIGDLRLAISNPESRRRCTYIKLGEMWNSFENDMRRTVDINVFKKAMFYNLFYK